MTKIDTKTKLEYVALIIEEVKKLGSDFVFRNQITHMLLDMGIEPNGYMFKKLEESSLVNEKIKVKGAVKYA
jgi:hypothetical protein